VRVVMIQLDSTHRSTPLMEARGLPSAARISPDGQWIAYVALQSGQSEVFLRRAAASTSYFPISSGGGAEPVWNPAGGELFYRSGARLIAVKLAFGPEPRVVRRDTLPFKIPKVTGVPWATYDVSRNGQQFLVSEPTPGSEQPIVVSGWLSGVRAMLEARR